MFDGIWLAVLGILGASSLIIAKKPDAKELIAKIAPYQGWMGAVSAIWGFWGVIRAVLHIGWMGSWPIFWFSWIVDSALLAALGLLLGVGTLKTFIKDQTARDRMDQTITKLAPYQGTLGLVGIGVGIWLVVASIVFPAG